MERSLLSAALIVKNEEHQLPGCLESLKNLGDLISEICVYDTGSTDRTVEIAQAAGCRVERGYWDDDFARARNAAKAMASSEWVLSVDADERLRCDVGALRSVLTKGRDESVDALQVPWVDLRQGVEIQVHLVYRLFRPGATEWRSRLHEEITRLDGEDPRTREVPRTVLEVRHHGYDGAGVLERKLRRNLGIVQQQVEAAERGGPARHEELVRALVDRARTARELGDIDVALADLRRVRKLPSGRNYRTFGMEVLVDALVDVGQTDEALDVIRQLRAEEVSDPQYCDWLEVRARLALRETGTALSLLRRIDVLRNALGIIARPRLLLQARMRAAMEEGEYLEAAACLVNLMAAQGVIQRKYGDLLVTLSRELPQEAVAELLLQHDRGHLDAVAEELDLSREPGPAIAARLRAGARTSGTAVHRVSSGAAFGV